MAPDFDMPHAPGLSDENAEHQVVVKVFPCNGPGISIRHVTGIGLNRSHACGRFLRTARSDMSGKS